MFFDFSKTSPDFINIPEDAPFPEATIIATGVANPIAQGQAITIVETQYNNAFVQSPVIVHRAIKVIKAITNTHRTK